MAVSGDTGSSAEVQLRRKKPGCPSNADQSGMGASGCSTRPARREAGPGGGSNLDFVSSLCGWIVRLLSESFPIRWGLAVVAFPAGLWLLVTVCGSPARIIRADCPKCLHLACVLLHLVFLHSCPVRFARCQVPLPRCSPAGIPLSLPCDLPVSCSGVSRLAI
jgi:hypothetical protein